MIFSPGFRNLTIASGGLEKKKHFILFFSFKEYLFPDNFLRKRRQMSCVSQRLHFMKTFKIAVNPGLV